MENSQDIQQLRARDFWASLVLVAVSIFFLWKTSDIPLFGNNNAGVRGTDWYNSAAVVPLAIFSGMLVLSLVMLAISIRAGGATRALSAVGIGFNRSEGLRILTISLMITAYVAGLVPRVDFVISSGLMITALTFGYHGGHLRRSILATSVVLLAGLYAFALHAPQSEWMALDDDWLALVLWVGLTVWVLIQAKGDRILKIVPVVAVLAPLILVCAMAFGFRQNVPARGGLIFKQIEYHYYVTLRPLWRD